MLVCSPHFIEIANLKLVINTVLSLEEVLWGGYSTESLSVVFCKKKFSHLLQFRFFSTVHFARRKLNTFVTHHFKMCT